MVAYESFLRSHITEGTLTLVDALNRETTYGSGEPKVTWRIREQSALRKIILNPFLNLGETYMNEMWDVEDGMLVDLLRILRRNVDRTESLRRRNLLQMPLTMVRTLNGIRSSKRNVSHHYDLDETLFRHTLDSELNYSCAYFHSEDITLEEAQQAKCELLLRKLRLEPGASVLDIGCGWGSLAIYLAEHADVNVVGITLSDEQLRVASEEVKRRGLGNQVRFELQDYRQHDGKYDGIVSVGMFEHVGKANYTTFFDKVHEMLKPDGVAVLHTIGNYDNPQGTNPWIQKYIFPGGYIPSLSDVASGYEKSGLVLSDIEVLRYHYAWTLQEWNRRFQQSREKFVELRGEKFCRMWEFYLVACQTAFEIDALVVYQLQFGLNNTTVPITRDYLYESRFGSL